MIALRGARGRSRTKRRRFRFSLNGLAIQLSALALSFTLVALLVVSGTHAALVQQNASVAKAQALAKLRHQQHQQHGGSGGSPAARPTTSAPAVPTAQPLPVMAPVMPSPAPAPVVELTDSAAGTAMFGGETLAPGNPLDRCIDVSYVGDVDPGPVALFAAPTTGDLAPYLDLSVDIGSADGVPGTCAGFQPSATLFQGTLAGFAATHGSYETGEDAWTPSSTDAVRRFRFRLAVRDNPAAAGRTAGFGFSWRTEAP